MVRTFKKAIKSRTAAQRKFLKDQGPLESWTKKQSKFAEWATKRARK